MRTFPSLDAFPRTTVFPFYSFLSKNHPNKTTTKRQAKLRWIPRNTKAVNLWSRLYTCVQPNKYPQQKTPTWGLRDSIPTNHLLQAGQTALDLAKGSALEEVLKLPATGEGWPTMSDPRKTLNDFWEHPWNVEIETVFWACLEKWRSAIARSQNSIWIQGHPLKNICYI